MYVNTTEISKILGITRQYVNQLVAAKGFPKVTRGKYDLEKVVKWYIGFVKNETENKYKDKLKKFESGDSQQRLNSYRADEALLNLLERQNTLIPADEALRTWKDEIASLKQNLYSLPNRVSHKCLSAQSKNEINEIIILSLNEIFEQYANGSINIHAAHTGGNSPEEFVPAGKRTKNIRKT